MKQLTLRHISTNKYGHRLSAYETPKMTGYIVSVTADGITSQYDFLDSLELAIEYRDSLAKAWEAWSPVVDKCAYEAAELLWVRYTELAHHAPYTRWELSQIEPGHDPWAFRRYVDDAEAAEMADMEATYAAASNRHGY